MTTFRPKRPILRIACALIALMLLLSSVWVLFGCASKRGRAESTSYAKLLSGGEKLSVRASITGDKRDVYLFAIDLWRSPTDLDGLEPIAKAKVRQDEAYATVKLKDANLDELACKGFVFAKKDDDGSYNAVSSVYYITNTKEIHKKGKRIDESELSGDLKGLIGTPAELLELGASSTLVTLDLSRFLRADGGDGALSFIFNGASCHIDKNALDKLDREILAYTKAGISVYLEIIQGKSYSELGKKLGAIAFESASPGSLGYALNMQSREGANMICAVLNLLTSRYSGGEYGRVDSLIIGRTVNNYRRYYADGLSFEEGVENYVKAVRVAYNLMLLHNPNGKVYISLGNNWSVAESGGVGAKEFMTAFANLSENGGDFFWQLCLEANASDASDSSIWDDPLAKNSNQFVSPANIGAVITTLSTSAYKCNGYMRNIVLNRFAIGGGDAEAQAASYAYAYFTALTSNRVNALIYAHVADTSAISGGAGIYYAIGGAPEAKKLTEVFKTVDNDTVIDVSYISTLIGKDWDSLYLSGSKNSVVWKSYDGVSVENTSHKNHTNLTEFFDGDTFGFVPISSKYLELRYDEEQDKPVLYASLDARSVSDAAGIISENITLESLEKAGYLCVESKIDATVQVASLSVRLSGYDSSGKELVYFAKREVNTGVWSETYFDIKEFINDVDSETLTLLLTVELNDSTAAAQGLWVSSIAAEAPDKADFPFWIIWTALGLLAAGGLVVFVIWFRRNYTFVRE